MDFFEFLNACVTPYHTVSFIKNILKQNGISFYERNGAIIAYKIPYGINESSAFKIALAHTDFPTLKLSPNPEKRDAGILKLHTEIYGSPILSTWFDRDLSFAGIIAYNENNEIKTKLLRSDKLFRIPNLAIHLNRNANQEGQKINPQTDMDILCTVLEDFSIEKYLASEIPENAQLLDFEIQFFDAQKANFGGLNNEWIYSGRLDNLSSSHAILDAFLKAEQPKQDFLIAAFFNHEEIGSKTRDGAGGNFLEFSLKCITESISVSDAHLYRLLENSFALSVDMAHAIHPNFLSKHESNHAPVLGNGIVLKTNANKRYASDLLSNACLKKLCIENKIPFQTFITRNDMPCGSTVGPEISARLGIPTVDIGEPMLSMHSIREMTACKDHTSLKSLLNAFYKD